MSQECFIAIFMYRMIDVPFLSFFLSFAFLSFSFFSSISHLFLAGGNAMDRR